MQFFCPAKKCTQNSTKNLSMNSIHKITISYSLHVPKQNSVTMYRRSTNPTQRSFQDRFIPRRINIAVPAPEELKLPSCFEEDGFRNCAKKRQNQTNYEKALRNILIPLQGKVLNFFPPKKWSLNENLHENEDWPVRARKRPSIESPVVILDMPQFNFDIRYCIVDWGYSNWLATIFEGEVHMWCPDLELSRGVTSTHRMVRNCVRWKKGLPQFAMGLHPNHVAIWDVRERKVIHESCCCRTIVCEIYSLEWVDDSLLLTGCNNGYLKLRSEKLDCLRVQPTPNMGGIIKISVSCNRKLVATQFLTNFVLIWKFPTLEAYLRLNLSSLVKSIAWHPRNAGILAVGTGYQEGELVMYNVYSKKTLMRKCFSEFCTSVDCVTFNPKSGELVASYSFMNEIDSTMNKGMILVLTNAKKIAEEIHYHDGTIHYFLWSMDGNFLASVGTDEKLCIWNFFGSAKNKLSSKLKDSKNELGHAGNLLPVPSRFTIR